VDKPEPTELFGTFAAGYYAKCHPYRLQRRIGEPDAVLRRGIGESGLWLCDRIFDGKPSEPRLPHGLVLYSLPEAARLIGIVYAVAKRILPDAMAVVLGKDVHSKPQPVWLEATCLDIRRKIKSGEIRVPARSLTKPLYGVRIAPARHTLAESQRAESEAYRKAYPFAGLAV
jgi:hypothetical protein